MQKSSWIGKYACQPENAISNENVYLFLIIRSFSKVRKIWRWRKTKCRRSWFTLNFKERLLGFTRRRRRHPQPNYSPPRVTSLLGTPERQQLHQASSGSSHSLQSHDLYRIEATIQLASLAFSRRIETNLLTNFTEYILKIQEKNVSVILFVKWTVSTFHPEMNHLSWPVRPKMNIFSMAFHPMITSLSWPLHLKMNHLF